MKNGHHPLNKASESYLAYNAVLTYNRAMSNTPDSTAFDRGISAFLQIILPDKAFNKPNGVFGILSQLVLRFVRRRFQKTFQPTGIRPGPQIRVNGSVKASGIGFLLHRRRDRS